MKYEKYFLVLVGISCGIYTSEEEALAQTEGYEDGFYEVYANLDEAEAAIVRFFIGVPQKPEC